MKKFQFRLQKVLDVNYAKEKTALEEFARAQNLVTNQKALIAGYKSEIHCARFSDSLSNIYELQNRQRYCQRLEVQITKATDKLTELESNLQSKRLLLIESMKNRKLLEKLKDKAWEKDKEEQEHEEQLFLDEIGVTSFRRKEEEI